MVPAFWSAWLCRDLRQIYVKKKKERTFNTFLEAPILHISTEYIYKKFKLFLCPCHQSKETTEDYRRVKVKGQLTYLINFPNLSKIDRGENSIYYRVAHILFRVQPKYLQKLSFWSLLVSRSTLRKLNRLKTTKAHSHHPAPASHARPEQSHRSSVIQVIGRLANNELLLSARTASIQREVGRAGSEWKRNKDPWHDQEWTSYHLLCKGPANNAAFDRCLRHYCHFL